MTLITREQFNYVSSLYTEGETYLRRWANISPVFGYRVVFDATLHVGQRHRRRANINPAFVQSIMRVLQPAWSRLTDYGWMDTSQQRRRWPNIYQTLRRCRLALPDLQPSKHEALNQKN